MILKTRPEWKSYLTLPFGCYDSGMIAHTTKRAALSRIFGRKQLRLQARYGIVHARKRAERMPDRFGDRRKTRKMLVDFATGKKQMDKFVIAGLFPKFFRKDLQFLYK